VHAQVLTYLVASTTGMKLEYILGCYNMKVLIA